MENLLDYISSKRYSSIEVVIEDLTEPLLKGILSFIEDKELSIGQDWIQTPANLWDKIEGKEYNVRGRNILGDRKRIGYYSNDQFVETIN